METKRIDAYQHVRNSSCIYRRVGDTDVFEWNGYKRKEAGLIADIDHKFKPYYE